jgi:hypothetical protein
MPLFFPSVILKDFIFNAWTKDFFFSSTLILTLGPNQLIWDEQPITCLHLVMRLKIHGAIPPPHTYSYPCNRPWKPIGLWDIEAPTFSRQSGHRWHDVSLTHWLPFTPKKSPGPHFWQRLRQLQGHSVAGRIRSIEKSNDLIRNQTCDLPACSKVPSSWHIT